MNGWITIGTKLDTKQMDKDLRESERKLRQYEKEGEKLTKQKIKAEADLTELRAGEEAVKKMTDESLKYAQTTQEVEAILKDENDTINLLRAGYSEQLEEIRQIEKSLGINKNLQKGMKKEIDSQAQALEKANKYSDMGKNLQSVNNTVKDITRNALRWALAIFGIRSAYNFLRNSIGIISTYNEQVATDIEYIKYALAMILEPVVIRLINLVKTLLMYVGYIVKAWLGVNIFANSGAKKFKDAKDNLKGASKNAKELNKQLAGFDEMNVLQDQKDKGGDDGSLLPSFDLSQMDVPIPKWLQWIVDHKDEVLAFLAGLVGFITALKFGLGAIMALGIGIAIIGIVYAVESLLDYIKDPSWENFGRIIIGIGIAIAGLGIAFGLLPAVIAGLVVVIVGIIVKHWEEIKSFLMKGIEWLEEKSDFIRQKFGNTIGNIYDLIVNMAKGVINQIDNIFSGMKKTLDGIILFVKGVFSGNWKQAWEGVKKIFSGIVQSIGGILGTLNTVLVSTAHVIAQSVGSVIATVFKAVVNTVLELIERTLNSPIITVNKLIGVINKLPGVNLNRLPTFNLPRLAKGGIVNMPGRGVMVGSAIAGERGAEGVIPLTDSQQMALLGEAIGKYITVNANITNTMNGRVISRELQKVQNENDFAFNR